MWDGMYLGKDCEIPIAVVNSAKQWQYVTYFKKRLLKLTFILMEG